MNAFKDINMKSKAIFSILTLLALGCTRNEEVLPLSTFPKTAEVFTDVPVSLTDQFFRSFDPADGANVNGFGTDDEVFYEGTTSIRIDVPGVNDDNGTFIGGIFEDRGEGRNLTDYDALTFWAKGSTSATIGTVGFGDDFDQSLYATTLSNIVLSTDWKKYTVPIPDPSKLVQEKGMFIFSAGTASTGGLGYTFWLDEIRFEKLGTLAHPRPAVLDGQEVEGEGFIGIPLQIGGLTQTFHSANGDITVSAAPSYFDFITSDPAVATVSELGAIDIVGVGDVEITAQLDGIVATGSLELEVNGSFVFAPTPTRDASDVISIYSNAYDELSGLDIAVFNNGDIFIEQLDFGTDRFINYANLAFVGIGWDNSIDVSGFTGLHIDVQANQAISAGDNLVIEIIDFGADDADGGGDDTGGGYLIDGSELTQGAWEGFDIPINGFTRPTGGGFTGSPHLTNIARVVLVGSGGVSNILVDNIYFYE